MTKGYVKYTHIKTIEHIILACLVVHEQLQVLEDALLHGHAVVVADGVLTQKVKLHHVLLVLVLLVEGQVLLPQGAAAYCVRCLSLLLLISCSQSKL